MRYIDITKQTQRGVNRIIETMQKETVGRRKRGGGEGGGFIDYTKGKVGR
jgi:hypothetical protein